MLKKVLIAKESRFRVIKCLHLDCKDASILTQNSSVFWGLNIPLHIYIAGLDWSIVLSRAPPISFNVFLFVNTRHGQITRSL